MRSIKLSLTNNSIRFLTNGESVSSLHGGYGKILLVLLIASTMMLAACGSSSSAGDPPPSGSLSGNWQFAMSNPDSSSPSDQLYGLQGGFLLQKNGSVTGQAVYTVSGISDSNGQWSVCNSGSATITGTVNSSA